MNWLVFIVKCKFYLAATLLEILQSFPFYSEWKSKDLPSPYRPYMLWLPGPIWPHLPFTTKFTLLQPLSLARPPTHAPCLQPRVSALALSLPQFYLFKVSLWVTLPSTSFKFFFKCHLHNELSLNLLLKISFPANSQTLYATTWFTFP